MLENRRAAPNVVQSASTKLTLQIVPIDRPRRISGHVHLDVHGAVVKVFHLFHLGRQMMIAVVDPAPIDTGAFDDRESVASVQRVQCLHVVAFGGCKQGAQRGDRFRLVVSLKCCRSGGGSLRAHDR